MDKSCELYLRVHAGALPALSELVVLVGEAAPAALLVTGAAGGAASDALQRFMEASRQLKVPVLIEHDAGLARALGADGVHLRADVAALADARRTLGEAGSIGVSCSLSRDEAMTMAENGADYIAFGEVGEPGAEALADMIAWWDELFEVACVAWLTGGETDEAVLRLIDAGADYLAVGQAAADGPLDPAALGRIAAMAAGTEKPAGT